jgi:epsilon-lactone hydrolase
VSAEAESLWRAFERGPKQVDLPLPARRDAGEHAEDPTSEPVGVGFDYVPELHGISATPDAGAGATTILYLFGGGYVLGSPASRRKTAGHLAGASRARVVVPAYRLAPEHPFPAAVDDALAAYRWLLDQGIPASRLVVAGDSAGGGLAVATLLAARDQDLPIAAGCVAMSPWADLRCTSETMRAHADVDIMCSRESLRQMADWYLDGDDPADPLASPATADLGGLPPLLALVGSDEVLMDDAWRLVRGTAEAGTDAILFVGAGMQHVWPTWAGAFPEADAAIALIGDWVRARTSDPVARSAVR